MSQDWIKKTVNQNKERREANRIAQETKLRKAKQFDQLAERLWMKTMRIVKDVLRTYNSMIDDFNMKLEADFTDADHDVLAITRGDYNAEGAHEISFDRAARQIISGKTVLFVSVQDTDLAVEDSSKRILCDEEVGEYLLKDFLATQ